jgi:dihydroorotate dehydrogenase
MSELDYSDWEKELKGDFWQWDIIKRLAFSFEAEHVHEFTIKLLSLASLTIKKDLPKSDIARNTIFSKSLMGLHFVNPIGLSAGFDIDAICLPALQLLGFGYIEVGGVTEHAQSAPKRIFRLPKDRAIINSPNFYNQGAKKLHKRLATLREKSRLFVPIGINLGVANLGSISHQYLATFKQLHDVADYITINVDSLSGVHQDTESLHELLDRVCHFNQSLPKSVPILLKLSPDLDNQEAIACAEVAIDYGLLGLVISNATTKRVGLSTTTDFGPGGLSGVPLFERSTQLLRCIAKDYGKKLVLMGSGGIMDGSQALTKLNAGADLLQVYTGFIYNGPSFVRHLLKYLKLYHFS